MTVRKLLAVEQSLQSALSASAESADLSALVARALDHCRAARAAALRRRVEIADEMRGGGTLPMVRFVGLSGKVARVIVSPPDDHCELPHITESIYGVIRQQVGEGFKADRFEVAVLAHGDVVVKTVSRRVR